MCPMIPMQVVIYIQATYIHGITPCTENNKMIRVILLVLILNHVFGKPVN